MHVQEPPGGRGRGRPVRAAHPAVSGFLRGAGGLRPTTGRCKAAGFGRRLLNDDGSPCLEHRRCLDGLLLAANCAQRLQGWSKDGGSGFSSAAAATAAALLQFGADGSAAADPGHGHGSVRAAGPARNAAHSAQTKAAAHKDGSHPTEAIIFQRHTTTTTTAGSSRNSFSSQ